MKNFKQYIAALSLLAMASCNPMHDVYVELDKDKLPLNNNINYTLNEADYKLVSAEALKLAKTSQDSALAKSINSKQAFNDTYKPDMFVPALLAQKYPHLGFTSTAMVTYNVTNDISDNVLKLQNLETQILTLADYQVVLGSDSDMDFFTPLYPANANLAKVLKEKYAAITKDTVMHIQYNYIESDPVKDGSVETLSTEDFEDAVLSPSSLPGWVVETPKGPKSWVAKKYDNNLFAEMTAYNANAECESWLISPAFKIEGSNKAFNFDMAIRFYTHGATPGLKVMVSDNYTGNYTQAKWTDVTSEMDLPAMTQEAFTPTKSASLSAFSGKTIHIAFVYNGEVGKTSTYRVDNVRLQENTIAYINPVYVKDVLMELYKGNWSEYKYGTVLSPSDYAKMGATNSFKDQAAANAVLPVFMKETFPYVTTDGTKRTVIYKVGSKTNVSEYTYTAGAFVLNNNIEVKTEQYVRNETKWIFDPSVTFDVNNEDYTVIVNWVKANKNPYMDPKYDNSEYYFGASYKYNNFNHTPAKLIEADERGDKEFAGKEMADVMKTRMIKCFAEVLLPAKYPDATPLNGIDTHYTAKYLVYDGANTYYTMKFILTGKGTFEYVEGPVKQ